MTFMQVSKIEDISLRILHDAHGRFLFPYQVFMRIREIDPSLASRIETAYPREPGNPSMGPASFVAHALSMFAKNHPEVRQEWLDTTHIEIEGILSGNQEATSIWAWEDRYQDG
jgi:hypothetical protein